MTGFEGFLTGVLERARREAGADGSDTVEAHHLLLAVTAAGEPTTTELLASAGLDHDRLRAALDQEFAHSLATAGVSLAASGVPGRKPAADATNMGASAKLVLGRGLATVRRKRDLRPAHVLAGILEAEVGTVPRALALAGVDRAALLTRVRREADGDR
jgi:ATP-dependent Clp protease ATP-binding subunit ClpA